MIRATFASAAVSALLVTALTGCVTAPAPLPEDSVRRASKEYWTLLLTGKYDQAYELVAPSARKNHSLESYKKSFGATVQWLTAEVATVNCSEPSKCTANVEIGARPIVPPGFKGTIRTQYTETWSLEDGRWWLIPKI